ncbi:MAG: ATP-binding cassette domain-containing protein [Candidatus Helarchaeota archaeon]
MQMNNAIRNETLKIMSKYGFWTIVKNYMVGVAGYIQEGNSKIYCEVLFPKEYPQKNAIIIFPKKTPIKVINKYKSIIESNKNMTPVQIIEELKSIVKELPPPGVIFEEDLDLELERISKYYKVSTLKDKYQLKIEFPSPESFYYSMELDVHNYPKSFDITFSKDLERIIGPPDELDIIKNWDEKQPLEILEIIDYVNKILRTMKESFTDDQKISVKDLTIIVDNKKLIDNLNFSIPSGELVGIYSEKSSIIKLLFEAFVGKEDYIGNINIFNKSMSDKSIKIVLLLNKIFSIAQLDTLKKTKLKDLNTSEMRRLLLSLSVLLLPDLILIYKPEYNLNDTEQKRIWRIIKELNEAYFITMLIYSETQYIKNSNFILIIDNNGKLLDYGTHDRLLSLLPTDEILILQLNQFTRNDLEIIRSINGIKFIAEERRGEKYRIFVKTPSTNIIKELFNKLGNKIFNLSKDVPSLIDVIYYLRYTKKYAKKNS